VSDLLAATQSNWALMQQQVVAELTMRELDMQVRGGGEGGGLGGGGRPQSNSWGGGVDGLGVEGWVKCWCVSRGVGGGPLYKPTQHRLSLYSISR